MKHNSLKGKVTMVLMVSAMLVSLTSCSKVERQDSQDDYVNLQSSLSETDEPKVEGVTDTKKEKKEKPEDSEAIKLRDNLMYILNLRYDPSSLDEDRIREICDEAMANAVISSIRTRTKDNFLSLEQEFNELSSNIIEEEDEQGNIVVIDLAKPSETDGRIQTVNGVRGMYVNLCDINDRGNVDVYICGNKIYKKVPHNIMFGLMEGNFDYYAECTQYHLYDDGSFEVKVISSPSLALSNKLDIVNDEVEKPVDKETDGDMLSDIHHIMSMDNTERVQYTYQECNDMCNYAMENMRYVETNLRLQVVNGKLSGLSMDEYLDI